MRQRWLKGVEPALSRDRLWRQESGHAHQAQEENACADLTTFVALLPPVTRLRELVGPPARADACHLRAPATT